MIKPSKDGTQLWFLPPEKSKGIEELDVDLVYSHTCPKCNNLVQAVFLTNKKISPKPWEEILTNQLDTDGHFKRIIPGRSERGRSRYSITALGRRGTISAELIRFTEHFDIKEDVANMPVCNYVAISSAIPEYLISDLVLACYMNPLQYKLEDKDWPAIKDQLINKYTGSNQYAFAPAVGPKGDNSGPECVFISRTAYQWFLQECLMSKMKPYQPPVHKGW